MDPKPNTSPFGATQPPATSSAPVPTPPFNTNPPSIQPAQAPVIQVVHQDSSPTIVTILLLLFLAPIGIVVMWIWPKWKVWVKVVITLITILPILLVVLASVVTLVTINPARQFSLANDASRQSYTNAIQGSVESLKIVNRGVLPPEVLTSLPIGVPVPFASSSGPGMVALCEYLTGQRGTEAYLTKLPTDPKIGEAYQTWKGCNDFDTGFVLIESGIPGTRITVEAPLMEVEASPMPQQ